MRGYNAMELTVYNQKFEKIYEVDAYESLIWTERYWQTGDFELYTAINQNMLELSSLLRENLANNIDMFTQMNETDTWMLLESSKIETDAELGDHITFSGRSLESILDRRIVWEMTNLTGKIETCIEKLLNDAIISPKIAARKMDKFLFIPSRDERIDEIKIDTQITGKNLLKSIEDLCKSKGIGFHMWVDGDTNICFQLYMGIDRSFDQKVNEEVIFSPDFDNLLGTNYLESIANLKNVTLVAGEDQAQNRKTLVIGDSSGYQRRELFVDARDLQTIDENGNTVSETEYQAMLQQRGEENQAEYQYIKAFEGEIEPSINFVYGRDFYIGDIVQLSNEYGIEGRVRILETVRSQDRTGSKIYPTFEVVA